MNITSDNFFTNKTIYALSTVMGQSALAVVRISGPDALIVLKKFNIKREIKPRFAHYVQLVDGDKTIDNIVFIFFKGPNSFTGEDMVELHLHGGIAIINLVLKSLSEIDGFEMAEPGEFTKRAFMNQKLDLVQAEGLFNAIHAQTENQVFQANRVLSGESSAVFNSIRSEITKVFASLEAMLDFPEDDLDLRNLDEIVIGFFEREKTNLESDCLDRLERILKEVIDYLDDGGLGEKIHSGFKIAIVGEPNVGKSSLMNYLAKKEIAIVSDTPGTTRDLVTVNLNIDGYQVELIDTAGMRETENLVEAIGIQKAKKVVEEADLLLIMVEVDKLDGFRKHIDLNVMGDKKYILVVNKVDDFSHDLSDDFLPISIKYEIGLDVLVQEIKKRLIDFSSNFSPVITTKRQRILLEKLGRALEGVIKNFWRYEYLDLLVEDVRSLGSYISQLTGDIMTEEILDEVFSGFCIGK
jgi:tRNA modification GTPase